MKLAILQKKSLNRQYEKSTGIVLEHMREAADQKADLLLHLQPHLLG